MGILYEPYTNLGRILDDSYTYTFLHKHYFYRKTF